MTIVFRFKDGFELPVECEYFQCDVHPVTGLISGYKISGITNNKPLYLRMEDIVCIWRKGGDSE
jgi:hypothetical protein